ncbi:MAG: hypothetical protein EOP07_03290 [Proteobacteria bacterium]|nr:MAG: hypothetical protein EOP07_03290 [Pseudomonadota bacterium]
MQSGHNKTTLIGFFSDAWDAERAVEELNFAGFAERLRYVENDNPAPHDNSRDKAGLTGFFAKVYGFDDEDEYLDSRGNWTVNPEAEQYFTEVYDRKNHVVLIQAEDDAAKAIEILHNNHARIEEQSFAFFNSVSDDRFRAVEGNSYPTHSSYHQTASIEPPIDTIR